MKIRNEAYQYYFFFIQERMNIFWKRYEGASRHLTTDPILARHKFTNVYRAQDRVSQFLIRNVIYTSPNNFNEIDVLLRILIFKVFNNIETWIYLENKFGPISISNFKTNAISKVLDERIKAKPIFSAAYMMAGSHEKYSMYSSKHERWLQMIEKEIIKKKKLEKIVAAKSLEDVYKILRSTSL